MRRPSISFRDVAGFSGLIFWLSIIALASFSQAAVAAPDHSTDSLWRKAVAIAGANSNWVPGLVITRSEVLHKGKVEATHEVWQRARLGTNGAIEIEIFKVVEDGKDVTRDEQGKQEKTKLAPVIINPFRPSIQDQVTASVTALIRSIAGRACVAYNFELQTGKESITRGLAWLDKESGSPVAIENMTFDPLPSRQMKRLSIAAQYESTNGLWRLKSTEMTATIGLLLLKAETRTTTTFGEFWKADL